MDGCTIDGAFYGTLDEIRGIVGVKEGEERNALEEKLCIMSQYGNLVSLNNTCREI